MNLAAKSVKVEGRLHDVSLSLEPGTITAICGPNGAGKSTLLETLAGLLGPDAGEVMLGEDALRTLHPRERARRIGYLPQAHEIAWDVPVRSLVELGRMPHGDKLAEPVDAALTTLDIAHLAERRAQSLSGGETARVLLARVLAGEPQWILADEPLAALDLAHQLSLMRYLRQAANTGTGVVLVLHDLAHAMNHADLVVVLDRGGLAAVGTPADALSEDIVARVWGVSGNWVGEQRHRAFIAR
ncbi:ABC transporter ATP-binding protein [Qipengyuania sp. RANM35]|uniref:ABC transporter ATP-binding protein n=1 Tax=Qipengyuania sp. RANM35 TaxID=3068635 RepID=UPI0034DB48BA